MSLFTQFRIVAGLIWLAGGTGQPTSGVAQPASDSAFVAALRARLAADTESDKFSGAVLVTRDGRTVFEGAYGFADRERRIPNTLLTQFRIGSMGKMFTALSAVQLVQAGKLRLDVPISTYLPNYPNAEVASKVTTHHLLTHTGGLGDICGPFSRRIGRHARRGGYSTVRDLARFAEALREHRLLDSAHTALLLTGKVALPRGGQYAYGFCDLLWGGRRFVGHSGGAPGMNGDLWFEPNGGYVVVVLSNLDPPTSSGMAGFIVNGLRNPTPGGGGGRPR